MVILGKVFHEASSRIEAESWINSTGKRRYPQLTFRIERKANKWLVKRD